MITFSFDEDSIYPSTRNTLLESANALIASHLYNSLFKTSEKRIILSFSQFKFLSSFSNSSFLFSVVLSFAKSKFIFSKGVPVKLEKLISNSPIFLAISTISSNFDAGITNTKPNISSSLASTSGTSSM